MALPYSNKSFKDLGGGIDQRSTPDNIPATFSEDLQNVVTNSDGFISKRPGFQGYYGYLPIRVTSITHSGTEIKFSLDSSVDVSSIDVSSLYSTPIVVQGKLSSAQSGDWSNTTNVEYYAGLSSNVRTSLPASGSPVTVVEDTHGIQTSDVFMTVMDNSANTSSRDWSLIYTDRIDIADSSDFDIDIEYPTLSADVTAFVGVTDKTTVSGSAYTSADLNLIDTQSATMTIATPGVVTVASHGLSANDPVQFTTTGTLPTGITASTTYYVKAIDGNTFNLALTVGGANINTTGSQSGVHTIAAGDIIITSSATSFTNNNILCQVLEKDSGASEYYRIFPDISINNSTGTTTVAFLNSSAAVMTVKVMLSQGDAGDFETVQIGTGAPGGNTVTTSIPATDNWYNVQVYENNAGILTWVMPDDVTKDESADTLSVRIINSGSSATYYIFYETIDLSTSTLVITDNSATSTSYTDTNPQLTLWGIPHEGMYKTSAPKGGHVTHIDSYRRDTEDRVVAGVGGNLYTARTRAEESTDFLIPTTNVDITGVLSTDKDLAPCFAVTGSTTNRTRGLITSDEVSDSKALINAVELVSSGVTKYTLTLTTKSGDLSTAISVDSDKPDILTVTGMAHDVHNGSFVITAVDDSLNTITVTNALAKLDDFDETSAAGMAAIYTDQVTLNANSKFLPGDTFITNIATTEPTVSTSSTTTVVLAGITSAVTLSSNLTVYGSRTGSVVPVDSTTNFVKGDMCTLASLGRQVRVLNINTSSDLTISSITGTGSVGTVTTSTDHGLLSGQKVALLRTTSDTYDGEQEITAITSTTTFTFASTETASVSAGVVLGTTIEIDESTTIADNTTNTAIAVVGRWIPIEAPTTSDTLPATTYIRHLDANGYEAQDTLRSAMVAENMYFTNNADEVMKFDGTSLYQAGLFRWQPHLFVTVLSSGGITASENSVAGTDDTTNVFTPTTPGLESVFNAGDIVVGSSGAILTIQRVDTVNNVIYTVEQLGGSETSLTLSNRFSYYFRLNAIDENKNVIVSAVTGASDFVVDMGASNSDISMRLAGFPAWGNYDYDKLELEIYRTKAQTSAPFFRVAIKDISFVAGDGYIDFTDTVNDNTLGTKDLDPVNTALLGGELGTAWSQPLRSKYVTSADNRLILANVKDYPELDIVIRGDDGVGSVTATNMKDKSFLFRRDATDTSTTNNMTDVATYTFTDGSTTAFTITPNTDIANTSTTFTVTTGGPGAYAAGDWVYMYHSAKGGSQPLTYAGWFQIASANSGVDFTVNSNINTTAVAADVDKVLFTTGSTGSIPVMIGVDGNLNQVDADSVTERTAVMRLGNAINCSMRMSDTALESTFTPWMVANAGSEYNIGQLTVRQPKTESTTMECVLPAAITGSTYYVNSKLEAAAAEVSAAEKAFDSRVIVSYKNYPELFNNPFGDGAEDQVIDVNAADGQEITGIIPFFGSAVFGSGQVEELIVVFKTNSIYLLNTGSGALSKIQSRGLGCTAPYSIAQTKDGIMFANNSGIYRLNRDQSISYAGKNMERLFRDNVNRDQLSVMQGHHYGIDGQYKLSVPFGSDQTTNNRVFVYDHQREGGKDQYGSWTQYTNHNTTGWANLGNDAFFSTTNGQVYSIRRVGDLTDYRDDASAVDTVTILLKAEDFGEAGARKVLNSITSQFHLRKSSMFGTQMLSSIDLDGDFDDAGTFTFTKSGNDKVKTARSAIPKRKAVFIQLKYINSTKDEDVILTGITYRVALVSDKGVIESSETT